jgi:uncharacterized membrane-anchored protein YhcB (DUF1043 family)
MKLLWGSWDGLFGGLALVAVGLVLGLIGAGGETRERKRVRELEDELRRMRDQQERYRASVAQHFGRTSDIFRNLTGDYRSLYSHLADGARTLAPDDIPALRFEQSDPRPPTLEQWADAELVDLDEAGSIGSSTRQR